MAETAATGPTMVSMTTYWKNTIKACELALGLLAPFENQDHYLVDAVTQPLRQLIGKGRDFNALTAYKLPPASATPSPDSVSSSQRKARKVVQLNFDPRTNWIIENDFVVHVKLPDNNNRITARAITNIEQLEEVIPTIRDSRYLALDCEFLNMKGFDPVLKVLQIAVSKNLGYAILVDKIGLEETHKRLVPVLEGRQQEDEEDDNNNDNKRVVLGWAFRADAQSIEAAFKGIRLPKVLDLQAKIKSVAIEQMRLSAAMTKYAADWDGLAEFNKAKQLGDTFQYLGPDCVWLKYPLPPEALVYAVFDVVSLIALHEKTEKYETKLEHYWPFAITMTYNSKALDRWYKNRAMLNQPTRPNDVVMLVDMPEKDGKASPKKDDKGKKVADCSEASEFLDDDPQFKADLEEAIRRSREDLENKEKPRERVIGMLSGGEGSGSASGSGTRSSRATSRDGESISPSDAGSPTSGDRTTTTQQNIMTEEETFFEDLAQAEPLDVHFADDIYDDRPKKNKNIPVTPGSWGDQETERATDTRSEQTTSHSESAKISSGATMSDTTGFQWNAHLAKHYVHQNTGAFAYEPAPEGEMDDESWNDLVQSSRQHWKKGEDMDLNWEEIEKKTAERPKKEPPAEAIKFNTMPMPFQRALFEQEQDSWDKETVRPNTMQMPLKGVPKFKPKSKGPKVVNAFDDDYDDSDSYPESDSGDVSHAGPAPSGGVVPNNAVEDTLLDELFIESESVLMHVVTSSAQLDTISIPSLDDPSNPVTVAITYQTYNVKSREGRTEHLLKALQLFLSTNESYTILTDRVYGPKGTFENSPLGQLLKHPKVKRICWGFGFISAQARDRLGFEIKGMCDLSLKINLSGYSNMTFMNAAEAFLSKHPGLTMFKEAKQEFLSMGQRKFSASVWDREKLPEAAIRYSALQGWVLHNLTKAFPSSTATKPEPPETW